MKKILFLYFSILLIVLSQNFCQVTEEIEVENPIPVLIKISPTSKVVNMPSFVLTAYGNGFVKESGIIYDNIVLTTNFIDSNEINATISSSLITKNNTGVFISESQISSVYIRNPQPGGGDSNTIDLIISDKHTFTDPVEISEKDYSYNKPAIAAGENGEVYIIFENYNYISKLYSISLISSTDYGNNWSSPENLVEFSQKCYNPAIAIGPNGDIYVTFYAIKLYSLYLNKGGSQWSDPLELTAETNLPISSVINVDRGNFISIIWPQTENNYNYKVYYTGSSGENVNFSIPKNVFANWETYSSVSRPAVSSDGEGNIYAAWTSWPSGGSRYSFTQFNYSNDEGVNWGSVDKDFGVSSSSDLGVDPTGNLCMVVSHSYLPFQNQIIFYRSTDKGSTFNSNIITGDNNDYDPKISIDSMSNFNVIFKRNGKCHYSRSIDEGQNWTIPFPIGEEGEDADLTLDNEGNIYIVYKYGADKLHFLKSNNI